MASIQIISFSILMIAVLLGVASAAEVGGFAYSGANGPDKWGMLHPRFAICSAGKMQSPINILKRNTVYDKKLGSLTRDYILANATLFNFGYDVRITYEEDAGAVVINGKNYTLKQMQWHTPSEHQINGVQYVAELHQVHQAKDGSKAVVTILYKYGNDDPFISLIKDKLDQLVKEKCGSNEVAKIPLGKLDTKNIERKTRKYYRYIGSLTTPPCTENVVWTILGRVRSMSKEQAEVLKAPLDSAYKSNARPLQVLNGRKVYYYHELVHKDN